MIGVGSYEKASESVVEHGSHGLDGTERVASLTITRCCKREPYVEQGSSRRASGSKRSRPETDNELGWD
jgi:hypothetical protein